jgi:hypothetical protein
VLSGLEVDSRGTLHVRVRAGDETRYIIDRSDAFEFDEVPTASGDPANLAPATLTLDQGGRPHFLLFGGDGRLWYRAGPG